MAQPGTLDANFGSGGKVTTVMGVNDYGTLNALAQQSDGKIIAVGSGFNTISSTFNVKTIRYQTNGALDNTFGVGGIASFTVGTGDQESGSATVIQPDGKILVAGYTYYWADLDFFVLRLKANGTLDSTFGLNGITIKDLNSNEFVNSIALLSNGKIIIAGSAGNGTDQDMAVMRFNSDGKTDTTFGSKGKVTFSAAASSDDIATCMKIQTDSKIVLGGYTYSSLNGSTKMVLARLDSNGILDNAFGTGGKVISSYNSGGDGIMAMELQSNGSILVGGNSKRTSMDMILSRYTSSGLLDNTFGNAGLVYSSFGLKDEQTAALQIQADGKILLAGTTDSSTIDYALLRFSSNGLPDVAFGNNGKVATDFANSEDVANAMLLQADGKALLAGYSKTNFALTRYITTPGLVDAGITNLIVPASQCGALGANKTVVVTIKNYGNATLALNNVNVNVTISGANTGSFNASNSTTISAGASLNIPFVIPNLPNLGFNIYTATLSLTGDNDSTNNKQINKDTAFSAKPTVDFTSTSTSNTYTFTPNVIGKGPFTYKWSFGDGSPTSNIASPSHHYSYVSSYYAKLIVTDACGTDSIQHVINITNGIKIPMQNNVISVYPNPANEILNIEYHTTSSASTNIEIVDLVGHSVLKQPIKVNDVNTLKISSLPSGVYLLKVNESITKIFVRHS